MTDNRIPLWLDCDPGHDASSVSRVDVAGWVVEAVLHRQQANSSKASSLIERIQDAFAILLAAYHPGIRLLGISTVFGNASLEKTTWNATSLLTAIGKQDEIPVYVGSPKPIVRPGMHAPTDIHGESGLDGTDLLPRPLTPAIRDVSAVDSIAKALKAEPAGTAWLVATGSMTNVAMLFAAHPDLVGHIKGLSIMGGAIGGGFTTAVYGVVDNVARIGNWTQFAEFNIFVDPEAAASIFDDKALAAKTTLIPLDLTHLVLARKDIQELMLYGENGVKTEDGKGKTTLRTMLVELLTFFATTYKDVFGIIEGPPLHDPLAVAAVLTGTEWEIPFYDYDVQGAELAPVQKRERFAVKVVTEGTTEEAFAGAETGRTIATPLPEGEEGVRIPRGLDIPMFWKVLEECVQRADEVNARKEPSG